MQIASLSSEKKKKKKEKKLSPLLFPITVWETREMSDPASSRETLVKMPSYVQIRPSPPLYCIFFLFPAEKQQPNYSEEDVGQY